MNANVLERSHCIHTYLREQKEICYELLLVTLPCIKFVVFGGVCVVLCGISNLLILVCLVDILEKRLCSEKGEL